MLLDTKLQSAASRDPKLKIKNGMIRKELPNLHKMLIPELKEIQDL
jgi:hypothetical protein